jgi:hypothetical protein
MQLEIELPCSLLCGFIIFPDSKDAFCTRSNFLGVHGKQFCRLDGMLLAGITSTSFQMFLK